MINRYPVDTNQELRALGAANMIGSFFLCYPSCGSLSRSAVVDSIGVRLQMHPQHISLKSWTITRKTRFVSLKKENKI